MLASSIFCGALLAAAPSGAASAQPAAADGQLSELVVTGSRIPRPNLEQATPVAVLTPSLIDAGGPQSLGDIIAQLPQVGSLGTLRANSNNLGDSAGIRSIDLRGLGLSRTLVLVDGERHVASDLDHNAVDINTIPKALVDRVEVITGGASAIYGSDAVTGVVNILTKRHFEGLDAEAQMGGYDNGFGDKYSLSATAGKNFLDGRLNLNISGFWSKEEGIDARDVPAARNYGTILNPADLDAKGAPITNDGIPDRLFVPNVGTELTTRTGVLINGLSTVLTGDPRPISFNAAGHVVPTPVRTGDNSFAFGQLPENCEACFFPNDTLQISSPIVTKGAVFRGAMDFTDHLRGSWDLKFVQSDVENSIQPSVLAPSLTDLANVVFLKSDNAFLTPEIRAALDPTAAAFGFYAISRFLNEGRTQDIRRRTYRIVARLDGDFDAQFANVTWNGALNYGETDTRIVDNNLRILGNFAKAIDSVINPATGQPACRVNVPVVTVAACVPYNPFGLQNSAAAMAYSFGSFWTTEKLTQQVANLNANFDTGRFLNLQGGPVAVAAGAEYRMERAEQLNDPAMVAGLTENVAADSSGGFNVYEGYLELNAPLLRKAGPGLDELSFDVAYRGAHYSTSGPVSAYKISTIYGPVSWAKLRGTYSRAIRAPNITEAFLPSSPAFFPGVLDPCSTANIGKNVNYAKNCAAAGLPAGFTALSNVSIPGTVSGNPDLDPEKSFSYTAGIVLTPPVVPNLAVTLDYYSIKIKDAITEVQAQDIVNNCYGSSGGLDPTYCSLISRTQNQLSAIHTTYVNASKLYTSGLELQISYAADVVPLTRQWRYTQGLDGRLSFSLTADYVMRLRNYPFQGNPSQVNILEGTATTTFGNNPQVKALAQLDYRQGPVSVSWTTRFISRQALFSRDPSDADHSEAYDIPYTEAVFYHDILVSYRPGGAAQGTELFAGIDNLFDQQPPSTVIGTGRDMSFDLGRFLFVGARYRR
jgi:outer membrane receptor protein involved in Fe transport